MRILQVGFTDLKGKRFNGYELNQELRKKGVETFQIVWQKESEDKWVSQLTNSRKAEQLQKALQILESGVSIQSLLYPFAIKLLQHPWFKSADVVHYHLIYPNWFALWMLPFLTRKKPSVWTLHDPWPMTGHCVHPLDCQRWKTSCGKCPYLSTPFAMKRDHTAMMWQIKKPIYQNSKLHLVVASEWMRTMVKQSSLMKKFKTHIIPFGIDTNVFKPEDKEKAKQQLGINPDYFVIGMRTTSDLLKGLKFAKKALRKLKTKKKIFLLSLGQRGLLNEFKDRFQVFDMGWVEIDEILVKAYNAIDVFLMPSIGESFGMMAVETMACRSVVLGFNKTALEKTIEAPKGGIVVPYKDVERLKCELSQLMQAPRRLSKIGRKAEEIVKKKYNFNRYIYHHYNLYKEFSAE